MLRFLISKPGWVQLNLQCTAHSHKSYWVFFLSWLFIICCRCAFYHSSRNIWFDDGVSSPTRTNAMVISEFGRWNPCIIRHASEKSSWRGLTIYWDCKYEIRVNIPKVWLVDLLIAWCFVLACSFFLFCYSNIIIASHFSFVQEPQWLLAWTLWNFEKLVLIWGRIYQKSVQHIITLAYKVWNNMIFSNVRRFNAFYFQVWLFKAGKVDWIMLRSLSWHGHL